MSVCYFGRHVQKRANYMDVLLACHFFQFSALATACLFAFVTPAGVFLERATHAFIRFQLFQPRSYMCVGSRVFRTSHTCIFPFPLQLFLPLFRLASCFQNEPYMRFIYVYYFGSRVEQVVWTDKARNFFNEMQFHHLNESNELTGLRTS